MTVKTAFKYIFFGFLISFLLLVGYVVQAGIAFVSIKTPDTQLWIPVPVALAHFAGNFIDLPLRQHEQFQEFWAQKEAIIELLKHIPGMPDADLVEVRNSREQVRIFKKGEFLCVQVEEPREKVNIRLPVQTIERVIEVLNDSDATVGDVFACLEWQSAGELVYVKTADEEIRISLW